MNSNHRNETDELSVQTSRRKFLARNVAAIGAIAASTLAGGTAHAQLRPPIFSFPTPPAPPVVKPGGPNCFLKGTKIRTINGERAIEDLVAGDMLPTVFGGARPVQWVGRYVYRKSDASKPWLNSVRPIKIAESAIAPNVPSRDLFVSGGHYLYLDGVLIPASNLVNGASITAYDAAEFEQLEYYHIKLASHDVIYAEGAPCETLLKVNESASNIGDYYRQYGEPQTDAGPCAPVAHYKGRRGLIASRARSAVSPWADFRTPLDVTRDRLEERGFALLGM